MIALELSCLAIVSLYVVVRARRDPNPKAFFLRLGLLMVASWAAEDTVIHAYHFYAYNPRWSIFIDQLPLMVIMIWPVVIHSAWDLAKRLCASPRNVPLAAAAIVLTDASLIEPVAVEAGLWVWFEPGIFAVPPIGIIGWALFAWLCLMVYHHHKLHNGWTVLIAPALVHPMLLVLWWGLLRWISGHIEPWPVVGVAWALSLTLAVLAATRDAGARVPMFELLLRVPAAGFFFVLLAIHGDDAPALIAYALAFAPPYLVLTFRAARAGRAATTAVAASTSTR